MHYFPLVASKLHRLILVMRRKFWISATFPNSGIRARSMCSFYAWVEHKVVVGVDFVNLLTTNVLFWFFGIVGWSGPDQPYMTTFMRPVPPTDMQLVLHKGGWRVSVSPTLVESNLTTVGPCWRLKQHTWQKIIVVLMHRWERFLLKAHSNHVKLATTK